MDPRAPCIIGVAQCTVHPPDGPAPEPLALWEQVCREAAVDTGTSPSRVLDAVGSLQVLYCQSWPYDDPAGRLAEGLGITPRQRVYSGIGGTTPNVLVARAARAIMAGELDVGIVVGAEALATVRQVTKAGEVPAWRFRDPSPPPFPFEAPFHPVELAHQLSPAWLTFALFDVARRAHLATPPDRYRRELGEVLAPMTEVAESNPYAWFPRRRSVEELIDPTPANRMVGYPYTKTMVAIMDVDMAAAVIVASQSAADALGVARDKRVYVRGWCYATDPVYVAEHRPLHASPAMVAASREALFCAAAGIDDIAHLDLYSCFASSIGFARDALGIGAGDGRPVTVTGGLPFAGGPGSCYTAHATAAMADVLRADPESLGLVSGVGMHMTKHAFGVYSSAPPDGLPGLPDEAGVQARLDAGPAAVIHPTHTGLATVATYSVVHDRSGEARWGVAVCDIDEGPGGSGARTYARIEGTSALAAMEDHEWVGRRVELAPAPGVVNMVVG